MAQLQEQHVNPCDDGTFSSSYGVGHYDGISIDIFGDQTNTTISTNIPDSPITPIALVNNGYDPILSSYGINRRKARGTRAVRINQNEGFHGYGSDDRMTEILSKTFQAESNSIRFDYFAILEEAYIGQNGSNHNMNDAGITRQSYFEVIVYLGDESSSVPISNTFRKIPADLPSTRNYNANNSRFKFNNWTTETIDLNGDYIGSTITVKFKVRDCFYGDHGGYVYVDNITNVCPPDLTCPPTNTTIHINEVSNCVDYNANMQVNVSSINWYYRICHVNNGNEVFIGNTTGNNNNQHAVNFSLPTLTNGNTYDNCNLIINAYPAIGNTACSRISDYITLSCDGNGGAGTNRKDMSVDVFPNPSNGIFQIRTGTLTTIQSMIVRNIHGVNIKEYNGKTDQIDISNQQAGIYMISITFSDGSIEHKRVLLK